MSLAELYGIGKNNRNALSEIRKISASATNQKLISVLHEEETSQQDDEQRATADNRGKVDVFIKSTDDSIQQREPTTRIKCMICRKKESKYNCPNCNVSYCSLQCYQSNQHVNCAQSFSRRIVKEELGSNLINDTDKEERIAMMDLLRRHKLFDGNEIGEEGDEITADEEVEAMEDSTDALEDIDLDSASVDQLLKMLSVEERGLFEMTIKDQNQEKAQKLMEKLMISMEAKKGDDWQNDDLVTSPWWDTGQAELKKNKLLENLCESAMNLSKRNPSQGVEGANLSFNILCVLLSYVYLVRHVNVNSLQDATVDEMSSSTSSFRQEEEEDEMPLLEPIDANDLEVKKDLVEEKKETQRVIREKASNLLPFLKASGKASKQVLESVEEASLFFVARIDGTLEADMADFLVYLYQDVDSILSSPRLIDVDAPAENHVVTALCDLATNLRSYSQRKLIFYSAFWLRLDPSSKAFLKDQVEIEIQRLQHEIDRLQDQARYEAANKAIQQQIVLP